MVSEPGQPSLFSKQIGWRSLGKGPADTVGSAAAVNHLCAVSGTKGLEESVANPGHRDNLSRTWNVTGLSGV